MVNGDPVIRREDVERLAYELWQKRGCPMGSPEDDWQRATDMLALSTAVSGHKSTNGLLPERFAVGLPHE